MDDRLDVASVPLPRSGSLRADCRESHAGVPLPRLRTGRLDSQAHPSTAHGTPRRSSLDRHCTLRQSVGLMQRSGSAVQRCFRQSPTHGNSPRCILATGFAGAHTAWRDRQIQRRKEAPPFGHFVASQTDNLDPDPRSLGIHWQSIRETFATPWIHRCSPLRERLNRMHAET